LIKGLQLEYEDSLLSKLEKVIISNSKRKIITY